MKKLLCVIMDGVGESSNRFGNAALAARTPNLTMLKSIGMHRTLYAHGTHVGLPSDDDIGNSEVGHNALGAGQVYDQGAKLVSGAIASGSIFDGKTWKELVASITQRGGTLHLLGLLSDGNVHSHEEHLFELIKRARDEKISRVRVHALLDGRDVGERSAQIYIDRLEKVMDAVRSDEFDIQVASGGGRMVVTMDRYGADWSIVERGWRAHVLGDVPHKFKSLSEAVASFYERDLGDQMFPPFVIEDASGKSGMFDGDGVIMFNFRGDRALEICTAFESDEFEHFDRVRRPDVFFAGMMEYDGDLHIPNRYLVSPPEIRNTLGEFLASEKISQFACSETQKYGHVTYFWNGNRSGKFSDTNESYLEIPSDLGDFDKKPEMKAREITEATLEQLSQPDFSFGRINFANGDMVGHTGSYRAAVLAVEAVDRCLGSLWEACQRQGVTLLVTADHGNCDEMFDAKASDHPNWEKELEMIRPKTAHTKNPVPLILAGQTVTTFDWAHAPDAGLSNLANTMLDLMQLPRQSQFLPSLLETRG